MARVRIIFRSTIKKNGSFLSASTGGTADQRGWNGGPARVERRTSTGGTADQSGWNGGPERVERRTTRVERRTRQV